MKRQNKTRMLDRGRVINDTYMILEPIGEGGAGQVFLAWHRNLQKNVVVKRIKDNYVGRINERSEADILKRLHHRYLPQVYDFIQMDKEVYTVIDYIDGNTLMDYIKSEKRPDEYLVSKWLRQLCEALDYLHTQTPPIIHSDIKPSNIMVDKSGDICLIDFNISFDEDDMKKISGYSAGYASPEQILKVQKYTSGGNYHDIRLDAKSDIFSLGASIYHAITLQNPVDVMNRDGDLWNVPKPMPYSSLLLDIIEKTLRRDVNERYQTAKDIILDIESMKVRDERYRQLNAIQNVYIASMITMLIAGIIILARGVNILRIEEFDTKYEAIVGQAGMEDYDKTASEAIELLNNAKYSSVMKDRRREKADLLYLIANTYFENSEYEDAIPFYRETIDTDNSNPEYFRDFAIAYARVGKINEAEKTLNEGIEKGLEDDDLYLVNAEIESAKGQYDNAIADFANAIDITGNEETLGRAYLLSAKAYRTQGDLKDARDMLERALPKVNDVWRRRIIREEGSLCLEYIESNGMDSTWLKKAEDCYSSLINLPTGTLNDWLNYALILQMKGELYKAEGVLNQIKSKYPDEYKIPLRQAFFEIEIQSGKEENSRDYDKTEQYYIEAKRIYEKYKDNGETDDEMEYLEELMRDIYDKGWL